METMKKRWIGMIAAAVMVMLAVFSFTACKVQRSEGPDKPNTDIDENPEASVFLTVGTLIDDNEKALMARWANKFQADNPEVSIRLSKSYSNVDKLIDWKGKDEMPDIVWTAGDQHAFYSHEGYFHDLSDETKFPGSAAFFQGFYDEVFATTHRSNEDAGVWYVPRDYNRIAIYYNKTIFDKMGIAYPQDGWTWEQFEQTCAALTTEKNGFRCSKAIEWRDWEPIYTTMMRNYNSQYVDNSGKAALRSQGTQDLYNWFAGKFRSYAIVGEGQAFRAFSNRSTKPSTTAQAAMVTDTYAHMGLYSDAATRLNWSVDVVSFPAFTSADNKKGYVGAGCSGYAITTDCTEADKLEWAWKFLKYCMSEQGYNDVADLGVVCPALKSMRNEGKWTQYESNGTAVNYRAFVDDSTDDAELNYFNVLKNGWQQEQLKAFAKAFWSANLGGTSYASAVKDFEDSCKGAGISLRA